MPAHRTRRRSRLPGLALAGLIGVLLGAGTHTVFYAEGFSYLSDDSRACVNCHIMRDQYDGWQHASHHAHASCNDCHIPHDTLLSKYLVKGENGFQHSKRFTLQNFHEPIRIRPGNFAVLNANCVRCHGELVSEIRETTQTHAGAWNCVHCHASVGHGPPR